MNKLSEKFHILFSSKRFPWLIIIIAALIRLIEYLKNRTLFEDEAYIALNILNRSFSELLQPLDFNQTAPIGFLITEKLIVLGLGISEYAFRLFPFICGIISLILFYKIATHFIKPKAIPIALGLFAISDRLIYYSSEAKPYSSDVTIALILFLLANYVHTRNLTIARSVLFGVIGAVVIWFSYPSIFMLAGVGLCLISFSLKDKDYTKVRRLFIAYSFWGVSLAVCYFIAIRNSSHNNYLQNFWAFSFMPFPPTSFTDINWFIKTIISMNMYAVIGWWPTYISLFSILQDLTHSRMVELIYGIIVMIIFFVGLITVFIENQYKFLMLISPILLTLLASGIQLYPFADRLILFLAPFILVFIAEGATQIGYNAKRNPIIIKSIIISIIFMYPLISEAYYLEIPRRGGNIKQALNYIDGNKKDGDIVYFLNVHYAVTIYYSKIFGLENGGCSYCNKTSYTKDDIQNNIVKLRGNRRVWLICTQICSQKWINSDPAKYVFNNLNSMGTKIDYFASNHGGSAYLYDLSESNANK